MSKPNRREIIRDSNGVIDMAYYEEKARELRANQFQNYWLQFRNWRQRGAVKRQLLHRFGE